MLLGSNLLILELSGAVSPHIFLCHFNFGWNYCLISYPCFLLFWTTVSFFVQINFFIFWVNLVRWLLSCGQLIHIFVCLLLPLNQKLRQKVAKRFFPSTQVPCLMGCFLFFPHFSFEGYLFSQMGFSDSFVTEQIFHVASS